MGVSKEKQLQFLAKVFVASTLQEWRGGDSKHAVSFGNEVMDLLWPNNESVFPEQASVVKNLQALAEQYISTLEDRDKVRQFFLEQMEAAFTSTKVYREFQNKI
jgi:hypothetical protein